MPKYMYVVRYNVEGAKGVVREGGSGRAAVVEKAIQSMGGKMESFYFAFGENDAYVTVDVPDNVKATALAVAVNTSGTVSVTTIPLLTLQEVDEAVKLHPNYVAPHS